jgi:D-hydroxyproline dehydrogenase subunit alpha
LLLAVAAHLREHGAEIRMIAEQAPFHRLASFSTSLLLSRKKLVQALAIRRQLSGVPFKTSCWPIRAEGRDKLESVSLRRGSKVWKEPCDYLACGFHLVSNIELALLLGCEIRGGFVRVNDFQESSVQGIFCAGELTGIGGVDSSIVEGQIAGYAAAGRPARAAQFSREKNSTAHFADALRRAFALRPELRAIATPDTIVCRCEDVKFSRLQSYPSWRAAKLQTRCGMGPCQGRICGPATQFLFGWKPESVRPPVFAAPLEILAQASARAPEQAVNQ